MYLRNGIRKHERLQVVAIECVDIRTKKVQKVVDAELPKIRVSCDAARQRCEFVFAQLFFKTQD